MSAHRTKQSLDLHHLVVNQSETPKADEFHVAGDTNVPQPEGDTGPLSLSSSSHSSQSETQPLTSANRRKLGSRRRNKQQQHVTDSATEKQDKPREELEGNTKCNEALETKQPERQEELNNQASKDDSSVTRGSSLWSSTTSGYSCEVQVPSTKNPQDIPEILILKNGNKQADKDEKLPYSYGLVETKLEVTGAASFLQSEEIKENTASSSDLISSPSVTENEKRREEESDLLRQDGNVEGNYLKGESHAQSIDTRFSTTPEVTTDKCNPKQNTEPADIKNENFSLHLDAQLQDCSVSTKESIDTNFSTSVNRRKLGSARRNKRPPHVKDPVTESEGEPVEKFAGFDFFETAIVSSLTETDVTSVEAMLEGMNRSPTDEIEKKETAHVGISELSSSNFLPTSSEPLMNQSNVREMPHELASVYSETNVEGKEREEDADMSKPWGSFHGSDLTNEPRVKSDLECPMNLEKPTEEDHGEHTEPERFVELAIDSSPNEELSTYEEQNEHFSLSEVSGPQDLYEEEVKPAEIHHSFDGANSEICLANLTDQAEVGDSFRSESSVKGMEDSVTEQEVSKPDYKQDEPPEMQSNVEAFKQMNEDDQVYDPKKPETSDMEGLDTAVVQVYANEGQLEDDIKPSVEQTSHQEKEGVPTDMTESKSPLESAESETFSPFDSQHQDTSLIIDDQNNTDFNPISNRRKLGSSRRNKRQKIVESPSVESEMSLMLDTDIQELSMQMMQEGRDKADPSQTEDVCDENQESAHSSHTGLSSVSVHSSSPVEQQVTEQPNSSASTHSPVTDTESKQDTDLLMRWGFLQADNSLYDTHLKAESLESSTQPEITTEKSSYREHTWPKYGIEQVADSSPKEEMSIMMSQNEHLSSSEVGGTQHSEDVVEEVHEEEVKPIHIDDSSVEESNPCFQTLESETKSPLDSQPVDNSVSIKEETQSGFKLTGNRRKLGSSRRLKGRRHSPEITGPEEEVVEITCSDEEKTEKETVPTGTINQEELKEQTSPDFNLTKKITSAVEEQENTQEMPEEDTTLSLNMMDNRTTVTTDFLNTTEEVKEPEDLTPLPVYDVFQMDLIQAVEASVWNDNSDSQNISNHDDNVTTKSVPSDLLDQEETSHIPNTESSPCDDDSAGRELCVRQTTNVNESEGDVLLNEAKSLMGALGSVEVDLEEERKDPFNEDHLAQETNTSIEVTHDEPFSVAQNETETVEIGPEENTRPKPAEKVGISPAADASNSRGETDNKDKTDQSNLDVEVDVSNLDMVEVMEELSSLVTIEENSHWSLSNVDKEMEINKTSSVHNDGQKLQSNTSDLQTIESNMIPNRDDSVALLPDQSAFHNEEFVNPAAFVHGTDIKAGEVDVSEEPTQQDDFRSDELQTTSVIIGRRSPSINVMLSSPTELVSPMESQNEYLSSSEVGGAQHSEDVLEEVHDEEVQPMHIDDSSVEESKPCVQTLESETMSPFDSQPVDNSLSIKEETQSGFKLTGNRRKLGSSRRLKGRRHGPEITGPEEEVVENTCSDEEKTEKETVSTGTINQEELKEQTSPDFNLTKKMTSAVEEQENTEEMPEEDTTLSLNMMDNRTTATTDFLNSTREVKEPEDLTPLPVCDVVQMDLVQSVEITSAVEDSVIIEALQSDKQSPEGIKEGLIQDQPFKSVEVPSVVVVDKEMLESVIQEPNNAPEGAHKTNSEMKHSNPHVSPNRRRKMGSTRRNHGSRSKVKNSHQEPTHTQSESVESSNQSEKSSYREHTEPKYGVEQVAVSSPTGEMSPIESQNEHLSSSEVGAAQHSEDVVEEVHEEEVKPIHMQTMHQIDDSSVEERNPCLQTLESEIKTPFDSQPVDNSVSIKEETQSGFKLTGNRRKLGSSRRLKGRRHGPEITGPEEEVVENTCSDEEKTEKETVPTGTINQEELKEQTSPDFNLTKKMTSAVEDSAIIEATQSGKQSPEGIKEGLIQDQPFKSVEAPSVVVVDHETLESVIQEPNNAPEGDHKTNSEMKDSSPHVSSPNRRRKMGSTRRNLGSRSKVENSNQKQELDKEDVNVGDVYSESVSVIAEKEPPINDQQESSDSEQRKEKVFETVELSHTGESQGKSPARQPLEENPDSLSQQAEREPHLTPDHLTALSPHDVTSEPAAGGRRRKMGSSRKSRGPQKDDDSMMSAQKERDAILTDESVRKTTQEHREESSALEEKLEVDESVKQSSSGVGVSNTPEHSRPLSGKAPERGTPVQRHDAEMRLRQESQKTFSLGDSRGADIGSKRYNVMLVGDSSVGKTSLMQRAQSGKFSFEIPASIGLDTSLWTVVVDGKPVVLQLWDTAGQERFHSITRQVFHKAQAFLLMYDITCSQSFTAISYWADCIQEAAPEDVTILLLGNKSDSGKRQVNTEEGETLAKEYNFEFMECSAATGDNVIHSLETVARMLSEKDDTSEESMVLHKEPPRSKRSGCC
ncbi:uncharacterized protein rab44 isoform X2 [Platichthys flesus]|uniref:uncharacterized protein rab44 isoform X2 n=1 Tax=Platichthys flesus TaxID=8260 RepID=UPI002DBED6C3|nr:uncharacterized protein rab44 isoform X2 [Platichthys flesus]